MDWNYIDENNRDTYPLNNQDVLIWDDYYGYNVCAHYEKTFEDKNGVTYEHVLGWVPVPEPINKRAFV